MAIDNVHGRNGGAGKRDGIKPRATDGDVMKSGNGTADPVATLGAVSRFAAGSLVAVPSRSDQDRRFADRAWEENAIFFSLLQQHRLRERLAQDLVDRRPHRRHRQPPEQRSRSARIRWA